MAEQGLEIVDSAAETTAGVAKAKERAGYRKFLASVRSPAEYGPRSKLELEGADDLGYGMLAILLDHGERAGHAKTAGTWRVAGAGGRGRG